MKRNAGAGARLRRFFEVIRVRSAVMAIATIAAAGAAAAAQDGPLDARVALRARRYEPAIKEAAARHGVDARLLWVIAYLETRFDPRLVSRKGARGMMQFIPPTAARFGLSDPHDALAAINAAARYVRLLSDLFGGRTDLVLAAYNAGEGAVDAFLKGRAVRVGGKVINPLGKMTGGVPPFNETRDYVRRGLGLLDRAFPPGDAEDDRGGKEKAVGATGAKEKRGPVRLSIYYSGAAAQR